MDDHLLDGALAHAATVAGLSFALAPTTARALRVRPEQAPDLEALYRLGTALLAAAIVLHVLNGWIGQTGALDPSDLPAVLLHTGYGWSVLGLTVSALLLVGSRNGGLTGPLVAGAAAGIGHGAERGAISGLALLHAVHLGSVAAWLSGVCTLAVCRPLTGGVARRFSAAALPLVGLAVGSGVLLAGAHLRDLHSAYASALGVKLFTLGVVGTVSLRNRRIVRRAMAPDEPSEALDRGVQVELLVAVVAVSLGAALTQVAP